jgi:23S rRNA (guanine745-N1)-methyltransferase
MTSILQCPVCHELLFPIVGGYQCSRKHTFDAARQGYVNFLLAHRKHSKEPGDSADMIKGRRRFLDLGLYNRVSDGIDQVVAEHLPCSEEGRALTVLDAGSGEGFYLQRLKEFLANQPGSLSPIDYYGVDISKFAVRLATQRDNTMHWFVASIVDLPFTPLSLDLVLNVFSMADFTEFSRILRLTGKLVIVSPGPKHLNGLRKIIYPVTREHTPSAMTAKAGNLFALASKKRIHYRLELQNNEEIMDLLAMTPYFWNIDLSTKARVEGLERLESDVDVEISVFQKSQE